MSAPVLNASVLRQSFPRSLWFEGLAKRVAPQSATDYLVDQANLRGFLGAFNARLSSTAIDNSLSDSDIIVGLLSPHGELDGRLFKLVFRLLQAGCFELQHLLLRANQENAIHLLYWLVNLAPKEEQTSSIQRLRESFNSPPRGYCGVDFDYAPTRLVRNKATGKNLWRKQL